MQLNIYTANEPIEVPNPRTFCGNISEMTNHPKGPILIAKNATYPNIKMTINHLPISPN